MYNRVPMCITFFNQPRNTMKLDIKKHVPTENILSVCTQGEPEKSSGVYSSYSLYVDEQHQLGLIKFQSGTIPENGVNGVTNESLLEIVAHRLECFQAGEFRCRENAIALAKIQEAILWLNERTSNRISRNVEGKNKL